MIQLEQKMKEGTLSGADIEAFHKFQQRIEALKEDKCVMEDHLISIEEDYDSPDPKNINNELTKNTTSL